MRSLLTLGDPGIPNIPPPHKWGCGGKCQRHQIPGNRHNKRSILTTREILKKTQIGQTSLSATKVKVFCCR